MENNEKFQKLLQQSSGKLLPLPTTLSELIFVLNNPDTTSRDISKIIEKDAAITAQILKLSNSAAYGFSQKIKTISHAIVCLGFKKIKGLTYTISSFEMLGNSLENYNLAQGELFRHSLAVAICSGLIAELSHLAQPADEMYIAGLLHDIGKVVLEQFSAEELKEVWEIYRAKPIKFYQAEQKIFGFDHAKLGGEISRQWNFPADLCAAIEHHHDPTNTKDNKNAYIVHIADGISKTLDTGKGLSTTQDATLEMAGVFEEFNLDTLKITPDDILVIREQTIIKLQEILTELPTGK